MPRTALFVAGLLLMVCSPAWAANYTVKAAGGGNYTTIGACAAVAVAGDTCTVYAGDYTAEGTITPTNSGSAGSPITFTVNPGDLVKITEFSLFTRTYIVLSGFSIGNSSAAGTPGVYLDGASHCTITGNTITHTGGKGIKFDMNAISSYNTISANTITYPGFNQVNGDYGIDVYGDHNLIDGNDISHTADYTHIHGAFCVERNNVFHDSSSTEFVASGGTYPAGPYDAAGYIHIDGMQTWGNAAWSQGPPADARIIHHLLIENNTMSNVAFSNCSVNCENNLHLGLFADAASGSTTVDGAADIVVRDNTYYQNSNYFTISQYAMLGVRVYNNTLYSMYNPQSSASNWSNGSTGGAFINNIVVNSTACISGVTTEAGPDASSTTGFTKSYNLLYMSGSPSCSLGSDFLAETGAQANTDPKFVNAGAYNFRLQASSPAIAAGGPLTTVAAGDTGSGTSLVVTDAGFFSDGAGIVNADWIKVGTASPVQISSINYATNTITLASAITRAAGNGVYLYKNSNGAVVLTGSSPDLGAYPYGGGGGGGTAGVVMKGASLRGVVVQ